MDPIVIKVIVVLMASFGLWHLVRDLLAREFAIAALELFEGVVIGLVTYKTWLMIGLRFELTIDGFFVTTGQRARRTRPVSDITRILFTRDGNSYQIDFRDGGSYKFPLAARSFIDAVSHASKVYVVAA